MTSTPGTLHRFFDPRAIAVVGASASAGKVGHAVMSALASAQAPVIPVHPSAEEILGIPVTHSVADLPDEVDLAIVATGAKVAVEATRQCAERGIPFVVVLASGFSEVGGDGADREAQLRIIAGESGTRILGPNTLGFQMPSTGVDTVFVDHASEAVAGGSLSLVSQSGSVAIEALLSAARYGFSIRSFVGLGNKADLGEMDFLEYFAADPDTSVIAYYIEDLSAGRKFLAKVRELVAHKPVLAIKAGRTASGASAASSHTGRLSGADRVIDGALTQHLVQRVDDDEELCDAAKVLSLCPVPAGNRVAVLSPAGGYGVMLADLVETPTRRVELRMAEFDSSTSDSLRETLLGFASVKNPVDLTASVNDQTFAASLHAVVEDPNVDMVVCVVFLAPPGLTPALVDELATVIRKSDKPVVVLAGDEDGTGAVLRAFHREGIAAFPSLTRSIGAVRNLERRRRIIELATAQGPGVKAPQDVLAAGGGVADLQGPLNEGQAKTLLAASGVRVPEFIVLPPGAAAENVSPPGGADCVVKVCSADVLHKTDVGGVMVGVTPADLADAVTEMRDRFPGADVLVEQMMKHAGIEVIVGAFRDRELGPCIMVGSGGVLAELQQDVAFRLLPCSLADAGEMIDELTISEAFSGYRGMPNVREAMVDLIMHVSEFVAAAGDQFSELDLNPVVFSGSEVIALDAALVVK